VIGLFKSNKIQTVGTIGEFLNPTPKAIKRKSLLLAAGTMFPIFLNSTPHASFAQDSVTATTGIKENVSQSIITAFNPLTDMVQGLSHPITLLVFTTAGIFWLIGRKDKAVEMMQSGTIGYIIVQIAPMLMKMLVQVTAGF
jgi:hypothetical protein